MNEVIGIKKILEHLPHRYPFVLVDKILEFESKKRVVGLKNVTINEPFFQGHFPDNPVMPGVLIVEAMAQVSAMLILMEVENAAEELVFFTGIDECRFRRQVIPGDQLRMEVVVKALRNRAAKMRAVATVDGEVAAEATLLSAMIPRKDAK